jgi:hypothetical protein
MNRAGQLIKLITGRCVVWAFYDVFATEKEAKRKAVKEYVAGAKGVRVKQGRDGLYAVLTWDVKGD